MDWGNHIRRVCENSLRNLGVEALGIFYQHRIDPNTPIEVVAETCAELIRDGKILHWGLCEVNADTIRRAHRVCPLTAVQNEYHLMHRVVEREVLPVCRELGIGCNYSYRTKMISPLQKKSAIVGLYFPRE